MAASRVDVTSDASGTTQTAALLGDDAKTSLEVTAPPGIYVVNVRADTDVRRAPSNSVSCAFLD